MEKLEHKIVKAIIETLSDRKGFDDWWDNIDDDIQQELIKDLMETVRVQLT